MANCSDISVALHDMAMLIAEGDPKANLDRVFKKINKEVPRIDRATLADAISQVVAAKNEGVRKRAERSATRIKREARTETGLRDTVSELLESIRMGDFSEAAPRTVALVNKTIQSLRKQRDLLKSKYRVDQKISELEEHVRANTSPKKKAKPAVKHGMKQRVKKRDELQRQVRLNERLRDITEELESGKDMRRPARSEAVSKKIAKLMDELKDKQWERQLKNRVEQAKEVLEAMREGKPPPKRSKSRRIPHNVFIGSLQTQLDAYNNDIAQEKAVANRLEKIESLKKQIEKGEPGTPRPRKKATGRVAKLNGEIKKLNREVSVIRAKKTAEQKYRDLVEEIRTRQWKPNATKAAKAKVDKDLAALREKVSEKQRVKSLMQDIEVLTEQLKSGDVFSRKTRRQKELSKEVQMLLAKRNLLQRDAQAIVDSARPKTLAHYLASPFNFIRQTRSTWDLSFTLRQGGLLVAANPTRLPKPFWQALRSFADPKYAEKVMNEIRDDPLFLWSQNKDIALSMTDLGLTNREEHMRSTAAEFIPGVAASNRAFTVFLNALRMNTFASMVSLINKRGEATVEEASAVAHYINVATGRTKALYAETAPARALLWSPQLTASRLQYAMFQPLLKAAVQGKNWRNPIASERSAKQATRIIAGEYARTMAVIGTAIGFGLMFGGEVEDDIRNSDFLKMKFGDTRFDILAGLQQVYVLAARLASGEMVSPVSGRLTKIYGEGRSYAAPDRLDLGVRWMRNKAAPGLGTVLNFLVGTDPIGRTVDVSDPEDLMRELLFNNIPMTIQDVVDAAQQEGLPFAMTAAFPMSVLGVGVQTFEQDD